MKYNTILTEKRDTIGIITLNRPEKLNATNSKMKQEIYQALSEFEIDDGVRVVLLNGAGRAFSTGRDRSVALSEDPDFTSFKLEEKLFHLDKPTIAVIHGYTLGDGIQIASLCDIIIASEDTIISFIATKLGGLCFASFTILPSIVGRKKANELLLTSDEINAREAERIGLVNKVLPREQLMTGALEMADRIAKIDPLSVRYTKRALRTPLANDAHMKTLEEAWPKILGKR
jgi:enoyl-CoA hydratase/carnithine racemase